MDSLYEDLFKAYYQARKNKRNARSQLQFELNFEQELFCLYDELKTRKYRPSPAIAFVVEKPVKREVFAAAFRDRVVHHLLYNYINPLVDKHLIHDCYACREGKGTSEGIRRVSRFMRACSDNYTRCCYVLKMDIQSYFMCINKYKLYEIICNILHREYKKESKKSSFKKGMPELVDFLLKQIIFTDPAKNCRIKGCLSDWNSLPKEKSMFYVSACCGLPIGNLTSQLFGNVYLLPFDHWIKREMGIKYYGRYVDDFVLVHTSKDILVQLTRHIPEYLKYQLGLTVHPRKKYLQHYSKGLSFIGAIIKPFRVYPGKRVVSNFKNTVYTINHVLQNHGQADPDRDIIGVRDRINSYLGSMKNYHSFSVRGKAIKNMSREFEKYFDVARDFSKIVLKTKYDRY